MDLTFPQYLAADNSITSGSDVAPVNQPYSQLQSPVSLGIQPDDDESARDYGSPLIQETWAHQPPNFQSSKAQSRATRGSKRKHSASDRGPAGDQRKKVSRACDLCKSRKVRCSGTQPCKRCTNQSLTCEYNAEHRRGRPQSPLPEGNIPVTASTRVEFDLALTSISTSSNNRRAENSGPDVLLEEHAEAHGHRRRSSRSSHKPDETLYEGHYIGPTSGIAFLHRVQRKFKQDLAEKNTSKSNRKPHVWSSVLSFGDGYIPEARPADFVFPSKQEVKGLVDRYFDFAMPTYRFLHRPTIEKWLEELCDENENWEHSWKVLSDAKASILLLIFATASLYGEDGMNSSEDEGVTDHERSAMFHSAAEQRLSNEAGPVRIESVQARLAQCIYLLGSSRINQAWYTFGTAAQMILALGLHRERDSQLFVAPPDSRRANPEARRRVFWSAYTLDRYLSVILGRPRMIRDEDVDQILLDKSEDANSSALGRTASSDKEQRVTEGPIFHAKLAKMIGGISNDLYPIGGNNGTNWMESAEKWTAKLRNWRESLPAFLNSEKVEPSMLIPIFQRQSTVLKLAYAHALIFTNRYSLLSNFAELSRRRRDSSPTGPHGSIKECIDAALLVVNEVNALIEERKMSKAFWFTHYISFCAIAALYVYTIQQNLSNEPSTEQVINGPKDETGLRNFQAAEKCQRGIFGTTTRNSPFRKYNIILGELQREALLSVGKAKTSLAIARESLHLRNSFMETMNGTSILYPPAGIQREDSSARVAGSLDFRGTDEFFYARGADLLPSQVDNTGNHIGDSRTSAEFLRLYDDGDLDMGLFGIQAELVGWSEFDSYAMNWPDAAG